MRQSGPSAGPFSLSLPLRPPLSPPPVFLCVGFVHVLLLSIPGLISRVLPQIHTTERFIPVTVDQGLVKAFKTTR